MKLFDLADQFSVDSVIERAQMDATTRSKRKKDRKKESKQGRRKEEEKGFPKA